MQPGLPSYVRLLADQAVAASVTLVDLGTSVAGDIFQFTLPATKKALVEFVLPFSVGATGGFKFQLTSSQTLVDYSLNWEAIDGVTASPGVQVALVNVAQNPFANAWAVAGNHTCRGNGSFKGHATLSSTITLQFACNSAANSISVLKGAFMRVTLL